MELTVETILSNRTSSDLTNDEIGTLLSSGYTIDNTSPRRVRCNPSIIEYTLKKNPNAINMRDPALIEALKTNDPSSNFTILCRLKDAGKEYSHLPTAELFDKAINNTGDFGANDTYKTLLLLDKLKDPKLTPKDRTNAIHGIYLLLKQMKDPQAEQFLFEEIKNSNIKPREMPDELLTLPGIVASRLDLWDRGKTELLTQIFQTTGYNPELEKDFAKATGCKSIEDYVSLNVANEGKRDNELIQLAAIKMYTYKKLHEKGMDNVVIYLSSYEINDPVLKGRYTNSNENEPGYIEINALANVPCKKMLKITLHEAEHAIQEYNIKNANINVDPDIDTYSKDRFLNEVYPFYYKNNYKNISYEYDAEFRAELENNKLKEKGAQENKKPNLFEQLKNIILSIAAREKGALEKIQTSIAKRYSLVRNRLDENGSLDTLDNFFERTLNELIAERDYEDLMAAITDRYPILAYQYNITPEGATKKTPKELVEALDNAHDEKEIAIYTGLIKSSMNIQKDANAQQNIDKYETLVTMPNIPLDVRKTLKDSLEKSRNTNKYIDLAETPRTGRSA